MRNLRERYKRPCKQAVLYIQALMGNTEGFVYWDFKEKK